MNKKPLLFFIVMTSSQMLFAGAWTREKEEAYLKVSLSQFSSDEIYRHNKNKKIAGPDFTDTSVGFYGEYGVTNSWTGVASFDFKDLESKSSGTTTTESGLTDLWLYGKKRLVSAPFVLSMQFGLKIPLGYDKKKTPPLGEGQFDWEERVLIGKSFYPFPGYANAELAYRKRMGDYSDVLPFLLETGVFVHPKLLGKLSLSGIKNMTNDTASDLGGVRSPNVFDKEYMKFTPALIFILKKGYSLEVYYETFISGANTAAGDTIGIGFAWQGKTKEN